MRSALSCFFLLLAGMARAGTLELDGELTEGAIIIGRTDPGSRVQVQGEDVQVGSDGYFVFGLPRRSPGAVTVAVRYSDGTREERTLEVADRDYPVTRIEGVPQKTVTPPPEVIQRIQAEQVLIDRARSRRDDRSDFANGFIWPVTGRVSGVYGSARTYNDDDRTRIHWGVDVAMPIGTPVHAPADGLITLAHPDLYFSGGTILMDHGHGMVSGFLHLSALHVEEGQHVSKGDLIGEIGMSGRATGPHLDWRIRLRGTWVDPATLVPPMEDVLAAE